MNAKVILLVVGLIVGGLAGWLTRPDTAEIKVGPLSVEVKEQGGPMTYDQKQHVAIFAVLGAVVGFGIGFVVDQRK